MQPGDASAIRARLDAERASLENDSIVLAYARVFFDDPVTTFELACMASNIVDEFDEWGPVLQADEDGDYSPATSIERLRYARDRLFAAYDERPRPPWPWHCADVAAYPRPRTFTRSPSMSTESLSERDGYIATFERECQTTLRLLRQFPADRLDLKPAERAKTAREIIWTVVVGVGVIGRLLARDRAPARPAEAPATLDELLAAFERAQADTLAILRDSTDADFDGVIQLPVGPRQVGDVRRGNAMWMFLYDQIHHRGQLTIYQRIAGGKVPSIYGPSADEPWT